MQTVKSNEDSVLFHSDTIDSNKDIISVGCINPDTEYSEAIITKLSKNTNTVMHQSILNERGSVFNSVKCDQQGNIFCVGKIADEKGKYAALLVKYDKELNHIVTKIYSGWTYTSFNGLIIDNTNNIICLGNVSGDGELYQGHLAVFDQYTNILYKKRYSEYYSSYFKDICIDVNKNLYIVGEIKTRENISSALLFKTTNNLVHLLTKLIPGKGQLTFDNIVCDKEKLICVGTFRLGKYQRRIINMFGFDLKQLP